MLCLIPTSHHHCSCPHPSCLFTSTGASDTDMMLKTRSSSLDMGVKIYSKSVIATVTHSKSNCAERMIDGKMANNSRSRADGIPPAHDECDTGRRCPEDCVPLERIVTDLNLVSVM
jgi:hypothetical protein